jgi:hypothetical protein
MTVLRLVPLAGGAVLEVHDQGTVGRHPSAEIFVDDSSMSRTHAFLEGRAGRWTVTDRGSANGTFLDGQRVGTAELRHGQELRFGMRRFRVEMDQAGIPTTLLPQPGGPPPPPAAAWAVPTPPPAWGAAPTPITPGGPSPQIPPPPPWASPPPPPPPAAAWGSPPHSAPLPRLAVDASGGGWGLWREGRVLVMSKMAALPSNCVRCGEPASERIRRTLSWVHPALALLICAGLIFYVIAYYIARKTASLEVPICERHRSRRRVMTGVGLGLIGLGSLILIVAAVNGSGWGILAALLGLLAGSVVAIVGSVLVGVKRIDDSFVYLKGVHASLVQDLPPWPGVAAAIATLAVGSGAAGRV